ncbi:MULTISPECIES: GNAT family N-acetyltransferase [Colwellia]|jgi:GNAT superfamily N-acetyltransferase|uniref:Acetyltransferase, GNAT family n=1 Tax=Colwellia psychrerythraea (strain 34H / ATCC BAA-681) TaxID=167879 RepID=Q47W58_COLP3|nr:MULTISPECIES: GNAT family N-acetyltransferase [Colwellia]AAZ25550.1 acetyltransferase, GNAT family [Colwellia psychrerythraea 34H]PKH85489.1 N-acetyltransferase [Colwellia sp. Bg11-28]
MSHSSLSSYPKLSKKTDKKAILRFYKDNHYSARFIGFDNCYLIKMGDNIIASVIISQGNKSQQIDTATEVTSTDIFQDLSQDKPQYLLHALLVSPDYQKQGYAVQLLKHTITHHQPLICFAHTSLSKLYLENGFTLIADDLLCKFLNPALYNRFQLYLKHKPELKAFIHQ